MAFALVYAANGRATVSSLAAGSAPEPARSFSFGSPPGRPKLPPSPAYLSAKRAADQSLTGSGKRTFLMVHAGGGRAQVAAAHPSLFLGPLFGGLSEQNSGGFVPPDPQLAVSPGFVVEMVNSEIKILSRTGGLPIVEPATVIFPSSNLDALGDPQLAYDALTGRFIAGILDDQQNLIEIAVSSGPDPGGSWRVLSFPFGANRCPDQPKLGFDDQIIAFSVNLFTGGGCNSNTGTPVGTFLEVIAKTPLLTSTGPAPPTQSFMDSRVSKIAPARSLSHTSIEYMASVNSDHATALHVRRYVGVPPTGGFHGSFDVPVSTWNDPPSARQLGTSARLDTNDNRVTDAAWRNGLLFAAGNDGCQFVKDTREHSCARVLSVSTVTHRARLQDDLGFVGEDAYYPALDPDVRDNLDVVIGFSSPKEYPSLGFIGYTARGFTDVWTVATGSAPIVDSLGSHGVQRLGDYFGAEVDPLHPNVVWATGEYGQSRNNWGTAIGSMSLVKSALPVQRRPPAPALRSTRYRGLTSQHRAISFKTSADGRHLVAFTDAILYRCAAGYTDSTSEVALSRRDTVPLATSGRFSFVFDTSADSFQRSGQTSVRGRFHLGTVTGVLRSVEHSRHHGTCRSGALRWSAHP